MVGLVDVGCVDDEHKISSHFISSQLKSSPRYWYSIYGGYILGVNICNNYQHLGVKMRRYQI